MNHKRIKNDGLPILEPRRGSIPKQVEYVGAIYIPLRVFLMHYVIRLFIVDIKYTSVVIKIM